MVNKLAKKRNYQENRAKIFPDAEYASKLLNARTVSENTDPRQHDVPGEKCVDAPSIRVVIYFRAGHPYPPRGVEVGATGEFYTVEVGRFPSITLL